MKEKGENRKISINEISQHANDEEKSNPIQDKKNSCQQQIDSTREKAGNQEKTQLTDWDMSKYFFEDDEEWEKLKQKKKKQRAFIVKSISIILALSLVVSGMQVWFHIFNIPAIEFVKVSNRLSKNSNVKEYKKAVVSVEWDNTKGTGFNIHPDGLIITNEHVVGNFNKVQVHFTGFGSYIGEVIGKFPELDLAIVDINGKDLPTLELTFEKEWQTRIGEQILFIGNPLAFTQIANEGTISGEVQLKNWSTRVMQITAPVYRGNSGSPVINKEGKVLGIIFGTIRREDRANNDILAVAVPSYYLEERLLELEQQK